MKRIFLIYLINIFAGLLSCLQLDETAIVIVALALVPNDEGERNNRFISIFQLTG